MLTEAGIWKCTDAEYFADYSAVSNSMLSAFDKSPAIYCGAYITRTIPDNVTEAMRRGSAFHKAMQFYGEADVPYIVCPAVDRRKTDGKKMYAESSELADSLKLPLVMEHEAECIEAMVNSVVSHPIASKFVDHSRHREIGLRWHDPETGILCKCKPDLISACRIGELDSALPAMIDYKSSIDPYPDAFPRSIAAFSYHRQAAHYLSGAEAVFGEKFAWALVVVGSEPPYETFVYTIDAAAISRGERERSRLLRDMSRRMDLGDWAHSASGMITSLAMPAWSKEKGDEL